MLSAMTDDRMTGSVFRDALHQVSGVVCAVDVLV